MKLVSYVMFVGLVSFALCGCGGGEKISGIVLPTQPKSTGPESDEPKDKESDLRTISSMFKTYASTDWAEAYTLNDLDRFKKTHAGVLERIKKGQYVVIWFADRPKFKPEFHGCRAYEKDTPTKGGLIVEGMGKVRFITAEEFQAQLVGSGKDASKSPAKGK